MKTEETNIASPPVGGHDRDEDTRPPQDGSVASSDAVADTVPSDPLGHLELLLRRIGAAAVDPELSGRSNRAVRALTAVWCKTLLYGKTADTFALSQLVPYCGLDEARLSELLPMLAERGHIEYRPGRPAAPGRRARTGWAAVPTGPVDLPTHVVPPTAEVPPSQATLWLAAARELITAQVQVDTWPSKQASTWLTFLAYVAHVVARGQLDVVISVTDLASAVGLVEDTSAAADETELRRAKERVKKQRATVVDCLKDRLCDNGPLLVVRAGDTDGRRKTGRGAVWTLQTDPYVLARARAVIRKEPVPDDFRSQILEQVDAQRSAPIPDEDRDVPVGGVAGGVPRSEPGGRQPPLLAAVDSDSPEEGSVAGGPPPSHPQLRVAEPPKRPDLAVLHDVEGYWQQRSRTMFLRLRAGYGTDREGGTGGLRRAVGLALDDGATHRELVRALTLGLGDDNDVDVVRVALAAVSRVRDAAQRRAAAHRADAEQGQMSFGR